MLTQRLAIEQSGGVVVASVLGSPFHETDAAELVEELTQRMRCDGVIYFVLDLARVDFLSSACLGQLVMFLQDLEHVRGRVALAGCRPNVAFVFKVTRLDWVFPLCADIEEARQRVLQPEEWR